MTERVLIARLDSAGDVLLTGPAVRAVAASGAHVVYLAGPRGRAAAELLPGVGDVLEYEAPWVVLDPPELAADGVAALVKQLRDLRLDRALICTSFHQSPLPLALLLRMAGVPWIGATSTDYPGSLLDLRRTADTDIPEPVRALSLAEAAGYRLPTGDDGGLRIRTPLPDMRPRTGPPGYVAVHPGAAVPARRMSEQRSRTMIETLLGAGHRVVVTGGPDEDLPAPVPGTINLCGTTTFVELAAVLAGASVLVAPNSGPAHLAAAVGTPVVSLFAPVVPAARWAPFGVPTVLLGDQHAGCAGSRARNCPIPGHPCLDGITDRQILDAVHRLGGPS